MLTEDAGFRNLDVLQLDLHCPYKDWLSLLEACTDRLETWLWLASKPSKTGHRKENIPQALRQRKEEKHLKSLFLDEPQLFMFKIPASFSVFSVIKPFLFFILCLTSVFFFVTGLFNFKSTLRSPGCETDWALGLCIIFDTALILASE